MKTSRFLLVVLLTAMVAGCGDPDSVKEIKTGTDGGRGKYDIYSGVGGGKQEQGSLFGPGGLFGSKNTKKDGEGGSSGGEGKSGEGGKTTDSKPAEKKAAASGD